jgi:hypothetical protein
VDPETEELFDSTSAALTSDNGLQVSNGATSNGVPAMNGIRLLNGVASNGVASNGVASNGVASNGVASNGVASNGVASNGMMTNSLTITPGLPFAQWLSVDTTNRRKVLDYTVQCALPPTNTVVYTWGGVTTTLRGAFGLGPTWLTGMTTADQESVSACLMARINARAATVSLDLIGAFHPSLNTPPAAGYKAEIAVWGNLYTGTGKINLCTFYDGVTPIVDSFLTRTMGAGYNNATAAYESPALYYSETNWQNPWDIAKMGFAVQGPVVIKNGCKDVCDYGIVGGRSVPIRCSELIPTTGATADGPAGTSLKRGLARNYTKVVLAYTQGNKPLGAACSQPHECESRYCNPDEPGFGYAIGQCAPGWGTAE